jgi:DNA-binding NarL/FixJ family response regulator
MPPKRNPSLVQIVLVDDHQIMREGLRRLLSQTPDLTVVGEAGEGAAGIRLVEQVQPDVVVIDIGLPDGDGVDFARQIRTRWPEIKVIILSALLERRHLDEAVSAGISGYVLKTNAADELIRAIRTAMKNETYLCAEACSTLLGGYKEFLAALEQLNLSDLSEREVEVLRMIANGHNTKEIAQHLGLSVKTVESHRLRIMTKLNLHSVAELTKYAIRQGLIKL